MTRCGIRITASDRHLAQHLLQTRLERAALKMHVFPTQPAGRRRRLLGATPADARACEHNPQAFFENVGNKQTNKKRSHASMFVRPLGRVSHAPPVRRDGEVGQGFPKSKQGKVSQVQVRMQVADPLLVDMSDTGRVFSEARPPSSPSSLHSPPDWTTDGAWWSPDNNISCYYQCVRACDWSAGRPAVACVCEVSTATDAGVTLHVSCWQHYQSFPQNGRSGLPLLFIPGQLTPFTHLTAAQPVPGGRRQITAVRQGSRSQSDTKEK